MNVIKAVDPIRFDKSCVASMPCFSLEVVHYLPACNFDRFQTSHIEGNESKDAESQINAFDTPVIIEKTKETWMFIKSFFDVV